MTLAPCFKNYNATIFTLGIWLSTIFPKLNGPRYQRIMMCNDSRKVKKSLLWAAGMVAFVAISCTCISLLIYSKNPNLKISEILPFFVSNYCPVGLKGLLGAGLLAMSISTVESFLNCNSVVYTNDIIPFFCKMFSKKTYIPSVFTARISTVFFLFGSLHFSPFYRFILHFHCLFQLLLSNSHNSLFHFSPWFKYQKSFYHEWCLLWYGCNVDKLPNNKRS